jgi:hypothetical protein
VASFSFRLPSNVNERPGARTRRWRGTRFPPPSIEESKNLISRTALGSARRCSLPSAEMAVGAENGAPDKHKTEDNPCANARVVPAEASRRYGVLRRGRLRCDKAVRQTTHGALSMRIRPVGMWPERHRHHARGRCRRNQQRHDRSEEGGSHRQRPPGPTAGSLPNSHFLAPS